MKFLNKQHEKAIKLKRESDKVYTEHEKYLDRAEKMAKKLKTPIEKREFNQLFRQTNAKYAAAENKADRAYYNHIHNNFNLESTKTRYADKKYKDGFMDERFINDLYKEQAKSTKKQQKTIQKSKTSKNSSLNRPRTAAKCKSINKSRTSRSSRPGRGNFKGNSKSRR